jgi:hypothetical protein
MMQPDVVRIGGGSAGYGDGAMAAPVLIRDGEIDYLMLDYLSEIYMPMAARARLADPQMGYVPYFPTEFYPRIAAALDQTGTRLVTNAGAVNPRACARAMAAEAEKLGLRPCIAVVDGDDLLGRAEAFRATGLLSAQMPEGANYTGIHAYLGAFPIARALALGADIVITGRVVDSALALGPLIHEFGWAADACDLLGAGSLIGHILECGAQASGGLFTDWREVGDYADIGYPIAEVRRDGTAIITKPPGTGGLVNVGCVAEQILYEIDDPQSYRLPDVTVDFSQVAVEQVGEHRVKVSGAKGRAPGPDLKAIATWDDGFIGSFGFFMRGPDAAAKARANAEAVLKRGQTMLIERNMPTVRRSLIEVIGEEESYGAHARAMSAREVFCRVSLDVEQSDVFTLIRQEANVGMVSMAPGMASSMMLAGPLPMARMEALMLPAAEVHAQVVIDDRVEHVIRAPHQQGKAPSPFLPPPCDTPLGACVAVPLSRLAWTRSGDKGDSCNVGVVARHQDYLPYIAAALTEAEVGHRYAAMFEGKPRVERYYLPGIHALNFVLRGGLDGGCTVSLRFDTMGKSAAQDLLDVPVPVPAWICDAVGAE